MELREALSKDLLTMTSWFDSEQALHQWAGPNFRFPYSDASFLEDLNLDQLTSYGLYNEDNTLLGFGQCYERLGRNHLARLVINPAYRGQGLSLELIPRLIEEANKQFPRLETSLFVLKQNAVAISCYKKLGFEFFEYPEDNPLPGCFYMVRSNKPVTV